MTLVTDIDLHSLIPNRDDLNPTTVITSKLLESSKLGNNVLSCIYSEKLDLNISLRLPDYSGVFQMKVMAIYREAQ